MESTGMVAFLAGLVLSLNLPVALGSAVLPALAMAGVLVLVSGPRWLRTAGWLGVGVVHGAAAMAFIQQARPPVERANTDVAVVGEVVGLVEAEGRRLRFRLRPQAIEPYPPARPLPRTIQVSWYDAPGTVRPGEVWRLRLRIKRPRGLMNPVAFDYERYLAGEGIDARAYVVDADRAERLDRTASASSLRGAVARRLAEAVPPGHGGAVLRAIAVGDRRAFDEALWDTLRRTGTAHLVAISGLHIGLVAFLGWLLGRWAISRLPTVNRRLPAAVGAGAPALAFAAGYALLAGWSLPTVRALAMLALVVLCLSGRRSPSPTRLVLITLVALAVVAPWQLLGAGFWLSYGAVFLLIAAARTAPLAAGRLALAVRLQAVLSLGMAGLTLWFFGEAAWLALPVNLVAIPLFSFVVVPGALIATALLVAAPWGNVGETAVWVVARGLDPVMHGLAGVAEAVPAAAPAGASASAVGMLVVVAGLTSRGLVPRTVVLVAAVALCWPLAPGTTTAPLTVTVLEVGQGTAVVAATPRRTLVYDTGPVWGATAAARFSLWPFLSERGRVPVERLVVSHADSDHAGGLAFLRGEGAFRRLLAGEPLEQPAGRCRAGEAWQWGAVRFRFLWPPAGFRGEGNASSCVLLLEAHGRRVLLAGDIARAQEARVLERLDGDVDVLLVPHHGSADGSSPAFVHATAPALAVISAGHDNAYGLPAPAVVARYRCQGATVVNTAQVGAVTVRVGADGRLDWQGERPQARRFYNEGLRAASFRRPSQFQYDSPTSGGGPVTRGRRRPCGN